MFQTGLHIALQAHASDWLTWLMNQVTALGYHEVIILLVISVLFGVSLRRGFLLFQIIFWTAVLSHAIKEFFGLPRPFFADSRVACLEPSWDSAGAFRAMAGRDFFDLPPSGVIDAYRLKGLNFGFPSGHTSGAFAVWGGLAVVFRKRALTWLALVMIPLIAFSRLYLGVHFLADILGGAFLGGVMLLLAWLLWRDDGRREELFAAMRGPLNGSPARVLYLFFLYGLPLLLALFSLASASFAGFCLGLNAAFALAQRHGLPEEAAPALKRVARVLFGILLFWGLALALRQLASLLPSWAASQWGRFLASALATFLCLWIGMKLFLLLGLYRLPLRREA